jgi:hypothetical protein
MNFQPFAKVVILEFYFVRAPFVAALFTPRVLAMALPCLCTKLGINPRHASFCARKDAGDASALRGGCLLYFSSTWPQSSLRTEVVLTNSQNLYQNESQISTNCFLNEKMAWLFGKESL